MEGAWIYIIPKLKGKKVIIRLGSGGQPIAGTIEGYNPFELRIRLQMASLWYSSMLLPLLKQWMSQKAGYRPD